MNNLILKGVLWVMGNAMSVGSRFHPAIRAQITRTFTFELSAGQLVIRQWHFDAPERRIRTSSSRLVSAEHGVHFDTAGQALRRLLSTRTVDGLVADRLAGRVRFQGSTVILLWFYGLTRRLVRFGREPGPRSPVPAAYLQHDPATNGTETIVREPAVHELDPAWVAAWEARAQLWLIRGATGEPMPEP